MGSSYLPPDPHASGHGGRGTDHLECRLAVAIRALPPLLHIPREDAPP
jgi:hypothetical protein